MHTDAPSPTTSTTPPAEQTLKETERQALAQRRRIALGGAEGATDDMDLPRVGLALSGGGVRSATFALGLMRGLAQGGSQGGKRSLVSEGLLSRVDYLSTVSGGGYIGAMWGRLVSLYGVLGAQRRLADSSSVTLDWLRRNGRYLTPSGSRDFGMAVVTYMRALLAIHVEFMFACMLLGLIVMGPHLGQHSTQVLQLQGWEPWLTPWWTFGAVLWLLLAPGLITGYWAARENTGTAKRWVHGCRDVLSLMLFAGIAIGVVRSLWLSGSLNLVNNAVTWPTAAALALMSSALGHTTAQAWLAASGSRRTLAVAQLRNQWTKALRAVTLSAAALLGLGMLDRLSWWVLGELMADNFWLWGGVSAWGAILIVLRSLMQPLQQIASDSSTHRRNWLPRLLDLTGLLGLLALVVAWLVLWQWFVFVPRTFDAMVGVPAFMRAGLVGIIWATWVLLTARNEQMANSSSLHSFYRARLTRTYLAVGNLRRGLEQTPADGRKRQDVTEVVEGDDTSLSGYCPEQHGGPIHLINTCLNQTRDDQSGLYNADRKGTAVVTTWRGIEVGPNDFIATPPDADLGTLGRWVAVSGAAASPGAGAYTSRGLALLVYFLGVRTGLWIKAPPSQATLRGLKAFAWRCISKPLMLASEASATFWGPHRPWWYLSDGGHFENTGVYALLKRELDFIILSDAGCDPRYELSDLENLVRKARIDFGAEIDFYTREEAATLFSLAGANMTVLSPEDMADNHSCRGVLLARIRYRERLESPTHAGDEPRKVRPEGTLLVVKPNLHDELDIDLLAYAQQHPDFPQQTTSDQSFDEAQWESYHRLGEDFGRNLHDTWLAQLPGWRQPARHGLKVAARLRHATESKDAVKATAEPLWKRSARASAIGTTLGLGASGTLVLALWQVQEQLQRQQNEEQAEIRQILLDASKGLQDLNGSCPRDVPDHAIAQASRVLELRGSPKLRPLEQGGVERLATHLTRECKKPAAAASDCQAAHDRFSSDLCILVNKPPAQESALNYWRPGTSPQDQIHEAQKTWQRLSALWHADEWAADTRIATQADPTPSSDPSRTPPSSPAIVMAPGPSDALPESPPPASSVEIVGLPGAKPSEVAPTRRASWVTMRLASACTRPNSTEPSMLYVQVYDENSRRIASQWRQWLLDLPGMTGLQIAAIDNVTRSAELRGQRRPVPWPKATFVLHDISSRHCAEVLSKMLAPRLNESPPSALPDPVHDEQSWIRELPHNQPNRRPGVIELWLPPGSLSETGGRAPSEPFPSPTQP